MALGFIARALTKGLAKLGEPSFLDGIEVGPVPIERSVDIFIGSPGRADDNYTAQGDVAAIPASAAPRAGQILAHPEGNYRLSRILRDNGYTRFFVIVPV